MEALDKSKFTTILSVGSGGSGQLLQGDFEDYTLFQPIFSKNKEKNQQKNENFVQNIVEISLGGTIGLGLTNTGEVYTWGEGPGNPENVKRSFYEE